MLLESRTYRKLLMPWTLHFALNQTGRRSGAAVRHAVKLRFLNSVQENPVSTLNTSKPNKHGVILH
jgi:hypothetical protein